MGVTEMFVAYAAMIAALGFAIFKLVQRIWLRLVLILALLLMMPVVSAFLIFQPGRRGGGFETFMFAFAFLNVGALALAPIILLFRSRRV